MSEKLFVRNIYVSCFQQIVKAENIEEAEKKLKLDHEDVIEDGEYIQCYDYSPVMELDMEVEDYYETDE